MMALLFVVGCILVAFRVISLKDASLNYEQKTNLFTRYLSAGKEKRTLNRAGILLSIYTAIVLLSILFKGLSFVICILPVLVYAGIRLYLKQKFTHDEKRVNDSRVVTATTSKVVSSVAPAVATVAAGIATGGAILPMAAGAAVGVGISKAGKSVADSMNTDMPDVSALEDATEKAALFYNPEMLVQKCIALGLATQDKTAEQLAQEVFKTIPEGAFSFPEGMPADLKAYIALTGKDPSAHVEYIPDDKLVDFIKASNRTTDTTDIAQ